MDCKDFKSKSKSGGVDSPNVITFRSFKDIVHLKSPFDIHSHIQPHFLLNFCNAEFWFKDQGDYGQGILSYALHWFILVIAIFKEKCLNTCFFRFLHYFPNKVGEIQGEIQLWG